MNNLKITLTLIVIFIVIAIVFGFSRNNRVSLPVNERQGTETINDPVEEGGDENKEIVATTDTKKEQNMKTTREIQTTDGTTHSIPLDEILSGGPGKDGIPSLDGPKFVSIKEASESLVDSDPGIALSIGNESRFYPHQILVWHEIVNDSFGGQPALVTYCPLCATGIVFDPRVDGQVFEFGVSGMLWQSNLLMYNRTGNSDTETLWSQVLGEGVVGELTGVKLDIIPSDTVLYGEWKTANPGGLVLSEDTGHLRSYGRDPYGDYYSNRDVSYGATFSDDRLHPKAIVLGIEIDGGFKAYDITALPVGQTTDIFDGNTIIIDRNSNEEIRMTLSGQDLSYVRGFWFSWIAVHPKTELFIK